MVYLGKKGVLAYTPDKRPVFLPASPVEIGMKVLLIPDKSGGYVVINPNSDNLQYEHKVFLIQTKSGAVVFNPFYKEKYTIQNMGLSLHSDINLRDSDQYFNANLNLIANSPGFRGAFNASAGLGLDSNLELIDVINFPVTLTEGITPVEDSRTNILLKTVIIQWDGLGDIYLSGAIDSVQSFEIHDSFGFSNGPYSGGGSSYAFLGNNPPYVLTGPFNLTTLLKDYGILDGALNYFIMKSFGSTIGASALYLINIRP